MFEETYPSSSNPARIFISCSSQDTPFAARLRKDLKKAGHLPWLYEWDIRVGESIPQKISEGLRMADYLIVVLSEHAVRSKWVALEWQTKYSEELSKGHIQVLPVLLRDCRIPALLKNKRFADCRESYRRGMDEILLAIKAFRTRRQHRR